MSFETTKDYFRIAPNFRKSLVQEVLPEYFQEQYPSLISFLEGYYEFLDSDNNFGGSINELLTIRDAQDASLTNLNYIFDEIALGVAQSQFIHPREALINFGNFFRVKGSLYSAEGFFRSFFAEDVEVFYPKSRLMRVGESTIGAEDDYLLQDGAIYQIFSVLIRSPISFSKWETLYRNFVHPSGFHLASETVLEGIGNVSITTGTSITDDRANFTKVFANATVTLGTPFADTSILTPDDEDADSASQRFDPLRTSSYFGLSLSMDSIAGLYDTIGEWGGYEIRFDDADSGGSVITMDGTFERFDMQQYQTYSYGSTSTV